MRCQQGASVLHPRLPELVRRGSVDLVVGGPVSGAVWGGGGAAAQEGGEVAGARVLQHGARRRRQLVVVSADAEQRDDVGVPQSRHDIRLPTERLPEVETHKNIDSVLHTKLHFKLTAYFPLAFKSRFMMKNAQETASRKRK